MKLINTPNCPAKFKQNSNKRKFIWPKQNKYPVGESIGTKTVTRKLEYFFIFSQTAFVPQIRASNLEFLYETLRTNDAENSTSNSV